MMEEKILVEEVMISPPDAVEPGTSVLEAVRKMVERGKSCSIIYRDGKLWGILTDRDIITKVVAKGLDPSTVRVEDVATSPVITVTPDTPVLEAIRVFTERRVRKIPVVREGRVVGLLTEHDVMRLMRVIMETNEELRRILGI